MALTNQNYYCLHFREEADEKLTVTEVTEEKVAEMKSRYMMEALFQQYDAIQAIGDVSTKKLLGAGSIDSEWVATEKVDGNNLTTIMLLPASDRGSEMLLFIGRRRALLKRGESFRDCHTIVLSKKHQLHLLMKRVVTSHPNIRKIVIRAELYGGGYPDEKSGQLNAVPIFNRVLYSKTRDIIAFDLELDDRQLHYDQMCSLYNGLINIVPVKKRGTLQSIIDIDVEDCASVVHKYHGLEAIRGNNIEGVVFSKVVPANDGKRLVMKQKALDFKETSHFISSSSTMGCSKDISATSSSFETVQEHIAQVRARINYSRLCSVLSKLSDSDAKNKEVVSRELLTDAMEEYQASNCITLCKTQIAEIEEQVKSYANRLINQWFALM